MPSIDHEISTLLKERAQIRARNREIAAILKRLRMRKARSKPETVSEFDTLLQSLGE